MSTSSGAFSPLEHHLLASSEQLCYVHCNLCDTVLAVSVPYTSLLQTVTVRCGHCTNLLSVNMRALLFNTAASQLHQLGQYSSSLLSPSNHTLLDDISCQNPSSLLDQPCLSSITTCSSTSNNNTTNNNNCNNAPLKRIVPEELPQTQPVNRPPEKRQRVPSAYNRFIKEEIQRIKAGNPDITHREAFSAAAKNWAHFPHIHFGLMPDQNLKKSSAQPQNYETSEHRVKREFEAYGPIKRVRLITDKNTNKPRGYGFIEYMHTRDMKNAYKQADGRKIDNRRVLVDVERGRTVPNWRPRRLGGGLGSSRIAGEEVLREPQVAASTRTRSEEPRARDDKDRDREKSRERDRERDRDRGRERERSRERSHDRHRDKEDRHHRDDRERDRDRTRDRDRERDGDRDKDRERDKDRDRRRDRDRDRERDRDRGRDKDRERDRERGRESRDRERDRDRDHDRHRDSRSRDRERDRHGADYDDAEHNYKRDVAMSDQGHGEYGQYDQQGDDKKYSYGHGHGHEYYGQHYGGKDDAGYNGQLNHGGHEAPEEGEAYDERDYGYYREG